MHISKTLRGTAAIAVFNIGTGTATALNAQSGFPIRTPPDQRLLATSPKFIAGTPRPSSLLKTKASTIRPYDPR